MLYFTPLSIVYTYYPYNIPTLLTYMLSVVKPSFCVMYTYTLFIAVHSAVDEGVGRGVDMSVYAAFEVLNILEKL